MRLNSFQQNEYFCKIKSIALNENIRAVYDNDWVFICLMGLLLLIGMSKWLFRKSFSRLSNLHKFIEETGSNLGFAIFYNVLYAVLLSLVFMPHLQEAVIFDEFDLFIYPTMNRALFFSAVILALLVLKFLFFGWVYLTAGIRTDFGIMFKRKLFFRIWFVFMYLILAFVVYYSGLSPDLLLMLAFVLYVSNLAIEYIYQFNNKEGRQRFSFYYFILYLCAFEILPIVYIALHWVKW